MRKGTVIALAGLIVLFGTVQVRAATLADMLASVQKKADKGQFLEAMEEINAAEAALWKSMPEMAFRRVVLVTEEPSFFGAYTPRQDNRYRTGEPVLIYAEPVGQTIVESGGIYSFSLTADYILVDEKGQIFGGQRDFGRWERASRRPVMEFMMSFAYDFSVLPPGNYTIETVIKDTNSGKKLNHSTPIVILE